MKLVIEHLAKKFDTKEVLKGIDFTFESGKIYGLLGRNGAGKTTFFNCLNKDITTDGGIRLAACRAAFAVLGIRPCHRSCRLAWSLEFPENTAV